MREFESEEEVRGFELVEEDECRTSESSPGWESLKVDLDLTGINNYKSYHGSIYTTFHNFTSWLYIKNGLV